MTARFTQRGCRHPRLAAAAGLDRVWDRGECDRLYAAWIGENAGRLKFSGDLLTKSPLSYLEELEMMRVGAAGESRQGHGGTGSLSRRSRLAGFLPGVWHDRCSGHAEARPGTVRRSRTIIVEYSGSGEYLGDYSAQNSPASQNTPRKFVAD